MDISSIALRSHRQEQGFRVLEEEDTLELWHEGQMVARFSAVGATVEAIEAECQNVAGE